METYEIARGVHWEVGTKFSYQNRQVRILITQCLKDGDQCSVLESDDIDGDCIRPLKRCVVLNGYTITEKRKYAFPVTHRKSGQLSRRTITIQK